MAPRFAFVPARWLAPDSPLRATERLVLCVICQWTNSRTSECFPSVRTIAAGAKMSPRAVQGAINALVKAGALRCEHRRKGAINLPNLYTVIGYDPPALNAGGVVQEVREGGADNAPGVVQEVRPNFSFNELKERPGRGGDRQKATPPASHTKCPTCGNFGFRGDSCMACGDPLPA